MRLKWLALIALTLLVVALFWDEKLPNESVAGKARNSRTSETVRPVGVTTNRTTETTELPLAPQVPQKYSVFPPKYVGSVPANTPRPDADVFGVKAWLPPAPPAPKPVAIAPAVSQPAPPVRVEVLNSGLEFVGAMDSPAGGQLIFLSKGLEQFSVKVGDTLDNGWILTAFNYDRIILKHSSSGQEQTLARFSDSNAPRSSLR